MRIRVRFTPKRRVRTYSSSEHEETEESEEEMDIKEEDVNPPLLQPTRRSSRAVKKSTYCEASSDEEEKVEKKRKVPSKYKAKKKKKVDDDDEYKLSEHSEDDKEEMLSNDESAQNKSRGSDEEGEVGPSDINIDELLENKFYRPDQKSVVEAVEDIGGIRYFNDQMVNPAQPKLLCGGMLRDYQITGYQWLKIMYENGESGILADEMGLGKTIQAIAMVCKLVEVGVNGPFLVCAPTTTVANWFNEFKKFAPKISLMLYHGTAPERYHLIETLMEHLNDKTQVVVITSYEILLRDRPALMKHSWGYLILDEGHRVKNSNSRTIKELKKLTIRGKLMLTGTPIQNNLTELWSLLNFLLPAVFDDMAIFRSWFNLDVLQKDEKVLSMLHQVLTPFLLRRSKSDVDIKIPPKREMLVMAPLACLQEKFYRATVDRSIRHLLINKDYFNITPGVAHPDLIASNSQEMKDETSLKYPTTRSKTIGSMKRTIEPDDDFVVNVTLNNMIMQLRKCCNHPYLIQYPLQPGTDIFKVDEDLITSCGKMMLLDRMLPVLKERKHKVLLFSQMTSMLDVLQDYCVMRKFSFVRFDGSTKCEDRFAYIEEFNNDPNVFLFLLSTRAGGLGINLTGADTVIIYDSDWNPQNDSQAQDRCHRIGQERPVMVYRMVTMATIDQQIMERAARKRTMEKMIMHEDKFKGKLAMELNKVVSPDELLTLLQSNSLDRVAENKESIISDEELNQMLDRSSLKQDQPTMEDESHQSTITDSPKARFQIIRTTVDTISV
uniref:lymphoid-specific helicase-like n=1 Tax=Ciona intestinalis TaxID=7719 RepID=UPI000EF54FE5|nr:lymphoid-specific helicase-like [Ciona intestinalis]|eukprot:XP_026696391.1 lymphoid-specific helicase-like [Ciona intestinalis]